MGRDDGSVTGSDVTVDRTSGSDYLDHPRGFVLLAIGSLYIRMDFGVATACRNFIDRNWNVLGSGDVLESRDVSGTARSHRLASQRNRDFE